MLEYQTNLHIQHEPKDAELVTSSQALRAKTLALACTRETTGVDDDNLLFMLTVAFLGLRRRFWDNTESPEFEKDQIQILSDLQAAPNSCFALDFLKEDASVMSDIVWVDGYPEIEQTIRMLRALASIE